jgi:hypothetical protein
MKSVTVESLECPFLISWFPGSRVSDGDLGASLGNLDPLRSRMDFPGVFAYNSNTNVRSNRVVVPATFVLCLVYLPIEVHHVPRQAS